MALNVGSSYYTELLFLLTILMSKFYLVHSTYAVQEYCMINDVCLVYDSHPVIEF